jgi:hypothetical protein
MNNNIPTLLKQVLKIFTKRKGEYNDLKTSLTSVEK